MKCGELPLTIYGYLWIDPWSLRGGIPVEMSANAYSVDLRLPSGNLTQLWICGNNSHTGSSRIAPFARRCLSHVGGSWMT